MNNGSINIRNLATGETFTRIPVRRSGYSVVRFRGHYWAVLGGPGVRPYITGRIEDVYGRT
jgi:hypothetical protein